LKVDSISFLSSLYECDCKNDNLDVWVKLENGKGYCVTVATVTWISQNMINGFFPASSPFVIVEELTEEIIRKALEDYAADDAYWLKIFSLSYGDSLDADE